MRLQVLALDYDGTIAIDGVMDPSVRQAIQEADQQGIATLLVTGRILADLQRVLCDLLIFHAIVAENGAVLHFPRSGRTILLAPPPVQTFLDELRHREIPFLAGQCVVEADAIHAAKVLAVVQETQLPLVLLFNRGRMMVLPQAVSKATGLRDALRALRLSAHNTIGIGDAENDHQLLAFCELGTAVSWGSPVLQSVADEILPGDGPSAVAEYIQNLLQKPLVTPTRPDRRRLHLGVQDGGQPFGLTAHDRNILIAGDTQSGKSWVAGILCEQLVLEHYCVCVIDPEGEYGTLGTLPSVLILDSEPSPPDLKDVERTLRYPDVSVVFDLSSMDLKAKRDYARELLEQLRDLRRRTGLPHRIVIDEAHYFLHDESMVDLLDLDLGGFTLVSWHASQLHSDVIGASDAIIATQLSDREEAQILHQLRGQAYEFDDWFSRLRNIEPGHAMLLPGSKDAPKQLLGFLVSRRLTAHVRHAQKYLSACAPEGESFVFDGDGPDRRKARSLAELLTVLAAAPDLNTHLRRKDLSRWVRDVFHDHLLANRLQVLEERYLNGSLQHPHRAMIETIRGRYGAHTLLAERTTESSS